MARRLVSAVREAMAPTVRWNSSRVVGLDGDSKKEEGEERYKDMKETDYKLSGDLRESWNFLSSA